jgi:FkbM family methyltransferase
MGFAVRARHYISNNIATAEILGWKWVIREKFLRRAGVEEVKFYPKGLRHPVYCRVNSSDVWEYNHLLGRDRTNFGIPLRPRYIVDAGANVGYAALRFCSDFPDATIIALEPAKSNVTQLKKNCAPYPNIQIEAAALWSKTTSLSFRSLEVDDNAFQVTEDSAGEIEGISIDEVMRRHHLPYIDLLKIDVEGSEKEVFSSNVDWLSRVHFMLIETHDRLQPGCTAAIERSTADRFRYLGIVDEYSYYEAIDWNDQSRL